MLPKYLVKDRKKQQHSYSGKQKQHTLKIQVIYNKALNQIISIHTTKGRTHDVTLARQHLKDLTPYRFVLADKGYIGLSHTGAYYSNQKVQNQPLSKETE